MKRKWLVGLLLIVLAAMTIILMLIYKKNQTIKQNQLAEEEHKIEVLYYDQNCAFYIGQAAYDCRNYYRSSNELDLKQMTLSLHAYNISQSVYEITLQDVLDYLDSEYADDGTLMVFSRPDSINDYISWFFFDSGETKILSYSISLNLYLKNNGYADYYTELSVEELDNIMPEYDQYKEQLNKKLETLYSHETYALGMEQYDCYKDFSYVNVNRLILNLAAYKYFNEGVEISVEDVKEFLDSEYDENGELYVLNPPENIAKYIEWFWNGGDVLMVKYRYYLSNYQNDNLEKYSSKSPEELDEELLCELIEEFENCPNREEYEAY